MVEQRFAWLFPGQGAQEVGMGRDLFDGSDAARRVFEAANDVLGFSVADLCFNGPESELQLTKNAQPALFTASVACLETAREAGSLPSDAPAFVAGHSLGEYTALVAAGALDLADGLRLVRERGRLMQDAAERSPGAMAAIIGLDEEAVTSICVDAGAEVCNLNAPGQTVIGGTEQAVEAAMALSLERGAQRGVRLKVSGAFHTSMMEAAAQGMRQAVADTPLRTPAVPVIANTSGAPITTTEALREELVSQVRQSVQWLRTMERLREEGVSAVIEFGPGRVLTGLMRRFDRGIAVRNVSNLAGAQAASPAPP